MCEGAGILQTLRCADEEAWLKGERLRGVGEEGEEEEEVEEGCFRLEFLVGKKRKGGEEGKEEQQVVVVEEEEEEEEEEKEEEKEEEMGAFVPPY